MGFHEIDEVPKVRLAHQTGRSTDYAWNKTTHTTYFKTYPIDVRRPAQGTETHEVYCGECGDHVDVVVPSVAVLRWRQRVWLVLGLLVLAGGIVNVVYRAPKPGPNTMAAGVMFFAALVSVVLLSLWWSDHGVSVSKDQPRELRKPHTVRGIPAVRSDDSWSWRKKAAALSVPALILIWAGYQAAVRGSFGPLIFLGGLVALFVVLFVIIFAGFWFFTPQGKAARRKRQSRR